MSRKKQQGPSELELTQKRIKDLVIGALISGGIMAGAFFVHLLWIALPALMIFAASLSSLMAHILKLRKLQK